MVEMPTRSGIQTNRIEVYYAMCSVRLSAVRGLGPVDI